MPRTSSQRKAPEDESGATTASHQKTGTDQSTDTPEGTSEELMAARALVRFGAPVIVCTPHKPHRKSCPKGCEQELDMPPGWSSMTPKAAERALSRYRPGTDTLALVTGHGIDVMDVDPKSGGSVEHLPPGVETFGETATPSGGVHRFVRSTGFGKVADWATQAGFVGDYLGGTPDGGSRALAFLPGSSRPKYPDAGYHWTKPLDLARLAEAEPDDMLFSALLSSGASRNGHPGKPAATLATAEAFVSEHSTHYAGCKRGVAIVEGLLGESAGVKRGGRHPWAARAVTRVVELMKSGCCDATDLSEITDRLGEIKPEGGREEWLSLVGWAIENTEPDDDCRTEHVPERIEVDASEDDPSQPWGEPDSIGLTPRLVVPLDGLPSIVRDVVEEVSRQAQTPPEIALSAAFGTLSACTRGVFTVQVHTGWNAGPTIIWPNALAASGERKDGAHGPVVAALKALERRLAAKLREFSVAEEGVYRSHVAAAEDAQRDKRYRDAAENEQKARKLAPRAPLRYLLDDATPEALGVHMTEQRGATAIFSTEATAFTTVAGRYSDAGANTGLLNKAYDGTPYHDTRIKREGIHIERPALVWCTAVQPEVLAGYADKDTEGSGFLARFMFFLPQSLVGYRSGHDKYAASAAVMTRWEQALAPIHDRAWRHFEAMTADPDELGDPLILSVEEAGGDLLADLFDDLELRKRPGGDLHGAGGWVEKHLARLVRLAALFALLEDPLTGEVSVSHVRMALSLHPALLDHSRQSMRGLRGGTGLTPEQSMLKALAKVPQRPDGRISTRDAWQVVRSPKGWAHEVGAVRDALEGLEASGWVRGPWLVAPPHGGRKSEVWRLHPDIINGRGF